MHDHTVYYFNNCKNRDHVGIYGPDAFYDLDLTGRQSTQALNLPLGQICVVARYGKANQTVIFDWFCFEREDVLPDRTNQNTLCRVQFGGLLTSQEIGKSEAAASDCYRDFFNVNGHFKRPSVLRGQVSPEKRPRSNEFSDFFLPEEPDLIEGPFSEGTVQQVTVNAYERNRKARQACIDHHGCACCICGFDFGHVYGLEAQGYIHVHHLKPLSEIKADYIVDPKTDLVPVCPNCHAMLHRKGSEKTVNEMKLLFRS